MRRLLADACLVLVLVAIGSYVAKDDTQQRQQLHDKIDQFESDVAQNKTVKSQVEKQSLNEIDENIASQLAKQTSQFIVDVVDTGTIIISDIFQRISN